MVGGWAGRVAARMVAWMVASKVDQEAAVMEVSLVAAMMAVYLEA